MLAAKSDLEKTSEAFRSIGEAAKLLGLQTHVLRYWEGKFPNLIKPMKRADGRRLFRYSDIEALKAIKILVHDHGLTLKGAKSLLVEQGIDAVITGTVAIAGLTPIAPKPENVSPEGARGNINPTHNLQNKLQQAFEAPQPASDLSEKSIARLQLVLAEMTGLKSRLDAARQRKAA